MTLSGIMVRGSWRWQLVVYVLWYAMTLLSQHFALSHKVSRAAVHSRKTLHRTSNPIAFVHVWSPCLETSTTLYASSASRSLLCACRGKSTKSRILLLVSKVPVQPQPTARFRIFQSSWIREISEPSRQREGLFCVRRKVHQPLCPRE